MQAHNSCCVRRWGRSVANSRPAQATYWDPISKSKKVVFIQEALGSGLKSVTVVLLRGQNYRVQKIWEVYIQRAGQTPRNRDMLAGSDFISKKPGFITLPRLAWEPGLKQSCLRLSVTRTTGINPEPGLLENRDLCLQEPLQFFFFFFFPPPWKWITPRNVEVNSLLATDFRACTIGSSENAKFSKCIEEFYTLSI